LGGQVKKLFGIEFRNAAEHLYQRFLSVTNESDYAPITLLEAEPGSGKSRLVQEFYEVLRSRSATHGVNYWPPLLPENETSTLNSRKVLGVHVTEFERPAGALPQYFWTPMHVREAREGHRSRQLEDLTPYLQAHTPYVLASIKKNQSTEKNFLAWSKTSAKNAAEKFAIESGIELLVAGIAELGFALPGVSMAITRGADAVQRILENAQAKRDLAQGGSLSLDLAMAELIHRIFLTLTSPDVPLVFVVEDLHFADEELTELIKLCSQPVPGKPIFVVGMAWSEAKPDSPYTAMKRSLLEANRVEVISHDSDVKFPRLSEDELAELAIDALPSLNKEALAALTKRWQNPFGLLSVLDLDVVRNEVELYGTDFDSQIFEDIPPKIHDIYRRRWLELDDTLREALMLAGESVRSESGVGITWPFMIQVILEAALAQGEIQTQGLSNSFELAGTPLGWTQKTADGNQLTEFREWILQEISQENFRFKYGRRSSEKFHLSIMGILEQEILKEVNRDLDWMDVPFQLVALAKWYNLLAREGASQTSNSKLSLLIEASWLRQNGSIFEAFKTLFNKVDAFSLDAYPESLLNLLQTTNGLHLARVARDDDGVSQRVLELVTANLGPVHEITLRARQNSAWLEWKYRDATKALDQAIELRADRQVRLGLNHEQTLWSEWLIILIRLQTLSPEERYETLIGFLARTNPYVEKESRLALQILDELAKSSDGLGLWKQRIEFAEKLSTYAKNSLGIDNAEYHTYLEVYCDALLQGGDFLLANQTFESSIRELSETLGTESSSVLSLTFVHCQLLLSAGKNDQALEVLEERQTHLERHSGAKSSWALNSAALICELRAKANLTNGEAHKNNDILNQLDEIFTYACRADDYPIENMTAIYSAMAGTLWYQGRYHEAASWKTKSVDMEGYFAGKNSRSYIASSSTLAGILSTLGQRHEAIALRRKLDLEMRVNKSSTDGQLIWNELFIADLLAELGDVEQSIEVCNSILAKIEAAPDMLQLMEAHCNYILGRCHFTKGLHLESKLFLEKAISLSIESNGDDYEDFALHMNHLARALREIDGQLVQAFEIFQELSQSPLCKPVERLWGEIEAHRTKIRLSIPDFDELTELENIERHIEDFGLHEAELRVNVSFLKIDALLRRGEYLAALNETSEAIVFEERNFGLSRRWYVDLKQRMAEILINYGELEDANEILIDLLTNEKIAFLISASHKKVLEGLIQI
jgi:hypothetical protein